MPKPAPTSDAEALPVDPAGLSRRLLRWYRSHHRDLPWRAGTPSGPEQANPYLTLVSELMLQQTQVATALPYFERFMRAFPTVLALAEADEQEVLTQWQGLGYYRRARLLHAAAKTVVEQHAGVFPDHAEGLKALPGVGRYTSGAIASIAWGRREPAVDGNVLRVVSRWMNDDRPIDEPSATDRAEAVVLAVMPKRAGLQPDGTSAPGDFNQAVMELGATICTPRTPRCLMCPVREHCRAAEAGTAEQLPVKQGRTKTKNVCHVVVKVSKGSGVQRRILVRQRPDRGLWAGLWEQPTWEQPDDRTPSPDELARWVHQEFGLTVESAHETNRFAHATSHRAITFVVYETRGVKGRLMPETAEWLPPKAWNDRPKSNPQRKIAEAKLA